MKLSMVLAAQRHREFIAHLSSECPRLGKAEMMGVRWFSTADDASLCGHKLAMPLVPQAMWLERDRPLCSWELRPLPGKVGRACLFRYLKSSVAGIVASGCCDVCSVLLVRRESSHLGLERVLDDPGVVRHERVLGGKTIVRPGDGIFGYCDDL